MVYTVQYSTIQYNTVQYSTIQYNATLFQISPRDVSIWLFDHRHRAADYNVDAIRLWCIQYNTVQYSTIQYTTVQYSTIQYNATLFQISPRDASIWVFDHRHRAADYNVDEIRLWCIQYNTVQYSTIQYNTVQYSTIQYNATLFQISPRDASIWVFDHRHRAADSGGARVRRSQTQGQREPRRQVLHQVSF